MPELMESPRSAYWHELVGDVAQWYTALVVYAASCSDADEYLHGPHIAVPVDLDDVVRGLTWLQENQAEELRRTPLPSTEWLRTRLRERTRDRGGIEVRHPGSPMHNFWHWING
jgi:hypothetical protein